MTLTSTIAYKAVVKFRHCSSRTFCFSKHMFVSHIVYFSLSSCQNWTRVFCTKKSSLIVIYPSNPKLHNYIAIQLKHHNSHSDTSPITTTYTQTLTPAPIYPRTSHTNTGFTHRIHLQYPPYQISVRQLRYLVRPPYQ
jgi:hypothetical protein